MSVDEVVVVGTGFALEPFLVTSYVFRFLANRTSIMTHWINWWMNYKVHMPSVFLLTFSQKNCYGKCRKSKKCETLKYYWKNIFFKSFQKNTKVVRISETVFVKYVSQ